MSQIQIDNDRLNRINATQSCINERKAKLAYYASITKVLKKELRFFEQRLEELKNGN